MQALANPASHQGGDTIDRDPEHHCPRLPCRVAALAPPGREGDQPSQVHVLAALRRTRAPQGQDQQGGISCVLDPQHDHLFRRASRHPPLVAAALQLGGLSMARREINGQLAQRISGELSTKLRCVKKNYNCTGNISNFLVV